MEEKPKINTDEIRIETEEEREANKEKAVTQMNSMLADLFAKGVLTQHDLDVIAEEVSKQKAQLKIVETKTS